MRMSSSSTASARCPKTVSPLEPVALERDVDGILGKPFGWLARGPDEFYCLGVCLYLIDRVAGVWLDDPMARPEAGGLRTFWHRFDPVDPRGRLKPLDILFWRWGPGQPHVVLVESPKWVVSCDRANGVHRSLLREAAARAEAAYRLKELA